MNTDARSGPAPAPLRRPAALGLALGLAAAALAGPDAPTPKQRAKEQLAVRAAASRVLDALRAGADGLDEESARLTEALARRMLAEPGAFRRADAAKTRARGVARELWRAGLGAALTNAVRAAQEQSPLPVRPGDVLGVLGADWDRLTAASADAFLSNRYDRLFADARTRAVSIQQREAERAIRYPEPGAVDAQWTALVNEAGEPAPNAEASLSAWITAQLARPAGALFDEVARRLDDAGRAAAAEAARQYARQTNALAGADLPGDARAADRIEPVLRAAVERAAGAARREAEAAGSVAPVYPAFSAALRRAGFEARRIEQERLVEFVGRSQAVRLAEDDAVEEMVRDPVRHHRAAESAERLVDVAMDKARDRLAAAYDGPARAAYFAEQLRGDGPAARAFRRLADTAVAAVLPAARARAAERQLAPLADGLNPARAAPDELVARWHDRGSRGAGTVDEALARLKEEGLEASVPALIVESAEQLVARVDARVRAACAALDGQLQIIRDLEREKAEALQRDVASGRPVDRIIREWRDALAARWAEAVPAGSPYTRVLARAEDQLEKTVRQLYDARRQERARAAAAESVPADPVPPRTDALERGTDPPETAQDEDRDKKGGLSDDLLLSGADVVLTLTDRSLREGLGALQIGDREAAAFTYDPAAAQAAADAIFEAVREPLTQAMADRGAGWGRASGGFLFFRRAKPPEFKIYVIVESHEVRHRTSLLLRKKVNDLLEEWSAANRPGREPVVLRWTVGLGPFKTP